MFTEEIERPFDSIESAQEYMNVLATTVLETMGELRQDQEVARQEGEERKALAIGLAIYKLKMLGCYVHKSRRTLNDLRMLRRLILNERASVESLIGTL
ncbi:MAG TPA: hypothetical protein VMA31_17420 [Bryobacteraceae bacterium]|nr:hypothetical protein [Bryobacteraceae bacterium]